MEVEPAVLAEPDLDEADSLVSSNDPDDLANEQTWPTEEEMNDGGDIEESTLPEADSGTTPKTIRRIPKGMSTYQAAWIIDEDGDDGVEDSGPRESESEVEMEEMPQEDIEEMQDMVDEDMETDSRRVTFQDLDNEEEERQ